MISELVKRKPLANVVEWVDSTSEELLYLSVLTVGEIRKGIAGLAHGPRRTALEAWLETDLRPRFGGRILPVDESVADRWGLLTATAAARGRHLPIIDGLLAATAIEHRLTLVTRDSAELARANVPVFHPWEL